MIDIESADAPFGDTKGLAHNVMRWIWGGLGYPLVGVPHTCIQGTPNAKCITHSHTPHMPPIDHLLGNPQQKNGTQFRPPLTKHFLSIR